MNQSTAKLIHKFCVESGTPLRGVKRAYLKTPRKHRAVAKLQMVQYLASKTYPIEV